jgi:hypothetical protein
MYPMESIQGNVTQVYKSFQWNVAYFVISTHKREKLRAFFFACCHHSLANLLSMTSWMTMVVFWVLHTNRRGARGGDERGEANRTQSDVPTFVISGY